MRASYKTSDSGKGRLQSGIVLPVVLIFMVIMTLIGVTAIRNVTLEERMAGNLRNSQVAFQAAEEALRFCEDHIQGTATKLYREQAIVTVGPGDSLPALNEANWANDKYAQPVTLKAGSASSGARCMIEAFQVSCKPLDLSGPIEWCNAYRVTARGFGSTDNTVVRVQSFLSFP